MRKTLKSVFLLIVAITLTLLFSNTAVKAQNDGDGNQPTVEEALAELTAQGYADCLAGQTFANLEDLFHYFHDNCLQNGGFPDDSTDWYPGGGFPDDSTDWHPGGGFPDDSTDWHPGGGFPDDSTDWHPGGGFPDDSTDWHPGGGFPDDSTDWHPGGGFPDDSTDWHPGGGFPDDSTDWHPGGGFPDDSTDWYPGGGFPDDSTDWHPGGGFPDDSTGWYPGGGFPDDSTDWYPGGGFPDDSTDWYPGGGFPDDSTDWYPGGGFPDDSTGWQQPTVDEVLADLIAQGFGDCLAGQTFANLEDLFHYFHDNCLQNGGFPDDSTDWHPGGGFPDDSTDWHPGGGFPDDSTDWHPGGGFPDDSTDWHPGGGFPDDSTDWHPGGGAPFEWTIENELEWLNQAGYADCLAGQTFNTINEIYDYIWANCQNVNPYGIHIPDCIENMPADITTLQGFYSYIVANCGDEIEIPACYLNAPQFNTDEEFLAWIATACADSTGSGVAPDPSEVALRMMFFGANNSESLGIQQNTVKVGLSPNPTNQMVYVTTGEMVSQYQIFDISGRMVLNANNLNADNFKINVSDLNSGVYTVKLITQNGKTGVQKLVVY